jgi:DHA1 family tetracycline resistance protein-like MFS transporter
MLLPIFLIVLVDVFALTLVIPLLAIYAEQFGATPFQATLLITVFAVCQLVSGPVLGRTSDRIGRKPMLLVSQVGTLAGLLVMASATSLAMIFVGRVIDGCTAGNLSLAQAWIADHTKPEERAKSFALIGIAFGLGFFLGPSVTGYLAQYGLRAPLYAAAAMSATSILCTATLLRTVRPAGSADDAGPGGRRLGVFAWGTYARYFGQPVLGRLLAQFFAFAFAFATFTSGFALFAERTFSWHGKPFGPREVGYLFAYAGFLGIILQGGLIGRLVQRFGERPLSTTGFVAMSVAYLLLGLVDHVGPLVVVATLAAFGQGVLRPTLTSLVSHCARADEQGVVLGLTQSLGSVAQIVAPPLGGWLIGHALLSEWAFVASAAAAVGLALGVVRREAVAVREAARPARSRRGEP